LKEIKIKAEIQILLLYYSLSYSSCLTRTYHRFNFNWSYSSYKFL